MRSTNDAERGMAAPETLGLEIRVEIRKAAIKLLEEMPEGVGRLVIDLGRTRHVDSAGLGGVRGFILRTENGETLDFTIRGPVALDGDAFPPDHLREHMASAESIAVAYRTEGGLRVVVRLTDASAQDG